MNGVVTIPGGAGFIGSHFTDFRLAQPASRDVRLLHNFSSGRAGHYAHHKGDARLKVIRNDVKSIECAVKSENGIAQLRNDTLLSKEW